jgi:DNA-binding GntR family transcriptional regulator
MTARAAVTRLPNIQQASLAQRAYAELKQAILDGDMAPGAALAEVELADALGISRTPVREALALLRRDGLVDAVPGGGNVVHTLTAHEVRELFLLREAVESLAVRELAASHRRPEAVDAIQRVLDDQQQAYRRRDVAAFLDADERFHVAICQEAGLPQAAGMLVALRDKMRQAGLAAVTQPRRMPVVLREHQAIVEALRGRPRSQAVAALVRHLGATRDALAKSRPAPSP